MSDHVTDEQRAWEQSCSSAFTSDVIWKLDAYRAALFLVHCARLDRRTIGTGIDVQKLRAQLIDATGSVSANIGEGYSRWSRADRLRFLGYALGSARECLTWYESSRDLLLDETIETRLQLVSRNRSLLLGLIGSLRHPPRGGGDREL
jgi:four helix bundle protein